MLQARLSPTNFTWSILEYFDSNNNHNRKGILSTILRQIHLLKPCSDERQNGFKLFKTKTK